MPDGINAKDRGLDKFSKEQRHDILEILEDRNGLRSTLVTSQLPFSETASIYVSTTFVP